MSFLACDEFIDKSGKTLTIDDLKQVTLYGVYLSAHWCPPCRDFTPILADFYEQVKGEGLEIIFGSRDQDVASFKDYFKTMPWIAFPFEAPQIEDIMDKYNVEGIPTLLIFKPDGTLITDKGVKDVDAEGTDALKKWL